MTSYRYTICDVFTDRPLAGNQLAVFTDATAIPDALLQPLAREINFSETVFCYPADEVDARLRIFTPAAELPFAGHPVLGTAVVLGTGEIRLATGVGVVPVSVEARDGPVAFGRMSQPVPTVAAFADADALQESLGIEAAELPIEIYDNGVPHVYVALPDEQAVTALSPDLTALARRWPDLGVNCFARAGSSWVTRMFAPGMGVPEDPATGSAAGPLAVHLARHGWVGFGEEIQIAQGAQVGRPSTLFARVLGNVERIEAVEVAGAAVIVGRGEFVLP